jgi:hypothetical protein
MEWKDGRTDDDNMLHEVALILPVSFELGNLLQSLEHCGDQFLVGGVHEVSDFIRVGSRQLTFHSNNESLAHEEA